MINSPLRLILCLIACVPLLAACETVEGAGRDLQTAGATVTDTAQDAQQ